MRKILKMIMGNLCSGYIIYPKNYNYRTYNNIDKNINKKPQRLNRKPTNNPIPGRSY